MLKIAEYMNCHEVPGKPIEKDEKVRIHSLLILGEITVRASTNPLVIMLNLMNSQGSASLRTVFILRF